MNVSRRWFIGGLASFGAFGGNRIFAAPAGLYAGKTPRLRFGVVSDIHFSAYARTGDEKQEQAWQNNVSTFLKTIEWFRDQGVDAVMIAGDMADNGMVDQLQGVADCWNRVFPDGKGLAGRPVAKLFTYGNHDWEGHRYGDHAAKKFADPAERARHILATDLKGNWERIFGEPFERVYRRNVKGYDFVGAHWTAANCKGRDETGIAGVKEFFDANGKTFDPKRPFFYFQHPHPQNTCYGKWGWGQDDGRATRALSPFANAIAFSGHSHCTLTNERTIWQGAFTSLGTSSLRYTGGPGAPGAPGRGYENGGGGGKAMKHFEAGDGRQGMLVSVYDDCVVFARRDFVYGRSLGEDWVLPLPSAEPKPFDFAVRTARSAAPEFPATSTLALKQVAAPVSPPKKAPKAKKGAKEPCWRIAFPAANAVKGARPYEYEVQVQTKDGATKKTFCVLANGFNMPLEDKRAQDVSSCVLAMSQLPAEGEYRFVVTPVSSLGKKGRPLIGDYVTSALAPNPRS